MLDVFDPNTHRSIQEIVLVRVQDSDSMACLTAIAHQSSRIIGVECDKQTSTSPIMNLQHKPAKEIVGDDLAEETPVPTGTNQIMVPR